MAKDRRTKAELVQLVERLDKLLDEARSDGSRCYRQAQSMGRKYRAVLDEARRHANIEDSLRGEIAGLTNALTALGEGLGH